jgi:S-adenosylmethionine:tRNA ribosyltransferase-isomerase
VKVSSFDFSFPTSLIAQHPLPERDQSRMMVVHRKSGKWEHRTFRELPEILTPDHFLVLNNTRVIPARLRAGRPGRVEQIEILLIREETPGIWSALIKPGRKAPAGQVLNVGSQIAVVVEVRTDGSRCLRFERPDELPSLMDQLGEPPLPPYIERQVGEDLSQDKLRYQTVYAREAGSVAAPTAGLHFTPEVLKRLQAGGIERCEILLHVGYGTFQPIRVEDVENHRMASEYFEITDRIAAWLQGRKSSGKLLTAVGTTTTRVLEYWARQEEYPDSGVSGFCDLFIYPGFEFRLLNGLLTNFHLPRSTLLMLVCAFAGHEFMLDCYREAVKEEYRFFSYGDCMLIL